MEYRYRTRGVCSSEIIIEIDEKNNIVTDLRVINGCNGNLKGISSLIKGMTIDEIIKKLTGITCGIKSTSCPDQIAKALIEYKNSK